ncbi:MAG: methyltransferase [Zymomonas mobilis subsp. pomaceae]|uniref:Methyltransferase type 11 n=1 Tax=Zymomonas mobilis subsp. pomaceae (strain ATCC 29192 / DSM 22645 / JCM 10191 / CCUG 17912 / NBRC 13757 / NCIMB 11200 / NRRL B-4491 / Barker I) TaxID=579138 RepID=F8EVH1_ZYMMT|nr:type 11 methyltransferase [Zymomonas mobilis]AEI37378.1 methyltransferase type 11 [Zymomonas mobilis subsp. pomaceae ATCC 29192]MDX5948745.1 methyltransferase [Zymomonas mobilis subsp. pomaceae]GEB88550.1 SAM-dependent methyltransferase [Zymomonas mobilis subsp. pomaceae]
MTGSSADDTLKQAHNKQTQMHESGPLSMFFQGFLKHPVMVGSIIPSSQKLINRMLSKTDWQNTKLFVEYGPGVGTFCGPVLNRMAPDATLIAIDTNPDFIAYLKRTIRDPRFIPVNGSAADVQKIIAEHGFDHADFILSGLPFSTLPEGVGTIIARETGAALRPGGAFLVYQFSPKVKNFLDPVFPNIDHEMEWINIPPAQLYWAWK